MAQNVKISELPLLSGEINNNDVIPIVDSTTNETKKITFGTIRSDTEATARSEAATTAAQAVLNAGKYIAADVNNSPFASLSDLQTGNHYYNGGQIDSTTTYRLAQNDFALVKNDTNNTYTKYIYQSNNWQAIATYSQGVTISDILNSSQIDAVNSGVDSAWKIGVDDGLYQKQAGLSSISIKDNDETNSYRNIVSRTDNSFNLKLPATIKATLAGNADTATTAQYANKAGFAIEAIFNCNGGNGAFDLTFLRFLYLATNGTNAPTLSNGKTYLMILTEDMTPTLPSGQTAATGVYLSLGQGGAYKKLKKKLYGEAASGVEYTQTVPHGIYALTYVDDGTDSYFVMDTSSNMCLGWNLPQTTATPSNADMFPLKKDKNIFGITASSLLQWLSTVFLSTANDLSDLSNKNNAIRYLTETASTLPTGAENSVKVPATSGGMGGSLTLSDIFSFFGLSNTNGTLAYTGKAADATNATNDSNGDSITTTYARANNVLAKSNNLSDLSSTNDAISNLISNAATSGVYTRNAKFLIYNNGIPASNATGTATISDLINYLKDHSYSAAFTYIVDSDQKLADWANNVAGNDYTSVLVKKGTYVYTCTDRQIAINLTQTGTKQIVGEEWARIEISHRFDPSGEDHSVAIGYETIPEHKSHYFIRNIEIACNGNSIAKMPAAIYQCVNLENLSAVAWGGRWGSFGVLYCEGLYHCNAYASYGISSCENVVECSAEQVNGGTTSTAIDRCTGVRYCHLPAGNSYNQSYSSPVADPTYACANTLNGGWNT